MWRPNTWQARSVPVRLVSMIAFHSSSLTSSVGGRLVRPAQLTRMSTLPSSATTRSRSASSEARSATSAGCRNDRRPIASISLATVVDQLGPPSAGDHVGARFREAEREGAADAGGAADDDRDAAGEIECFHAHVCVRRLTLPGVCYTRARVSWTACGLAPNRCGRRQARAAPRSPDRRAVGRPARPPSLVGGPSSPRRFFGGLPLLGHDEVLVHHLARALDVADAQRIVDGAVHLGRFAQVAGAAGGLAALLVEERGDHLDERRENRIAGRGGDGAMEADVVDAGTRAALRATRTCR